MTYTVNAHPNIVSSLLLQIIRACYCVTEIKKKKTGLKVMETQLLPLQWVDFTIN